MKAAPQTVKKRPTLNRKLRSLGLVFVLIVGCACTLIFSYVELVNQKTSIHRQLEQTILLQQQFIDKWLEDRMSDIRLVANYPAVESGDTDQTQQLLGLVKRNHGEFRSLTSVDDKGYTADGLNIEDRPYFAEARRGNDSISDVLLSLKDGKRIIVFAAPVTGKDGLFKGLAMGTVELTTIERLMERFTYGEKGQTYLVDRDGTLITGEGSGAGHPVRVGPALLERADTGIQSRHAYRNYDGIPVYGDYLWTKNGSWLIIGEAARKDVLASLYTELEYASLFILLAMLAAVLVMLRTSKKLANPVDHLLRGVRMIKDGGYHYRIDPGVLDASTVEFRQLGLTFNAMSDTILEHTAALSKERNFASSIIDTAASLIVVLDKDGRILRFNASCETATGYTFEEMRNLSIYDRLIPENERAAVETHFNELMIARATNRNENHWRARSGELRLIAWSNTILLDTDGEIKHIIGIGIDITEQRKVEQALEESRLRLGTIIETVPSGIVVVEDNGMISMANRMAEDIFGMDKASIVNRAYQDAVWVLYDFAGNRMAVDDFPVAVAMRTGRPVTNSEFIFEKPGGARTMISCNCSPVFDREGRIRSVLVSLSDITERIAVQSELQAANDELKKLSSLDGLTGVFNRRYFNERLREEWDKHALKNEPLSLIMLDIDYFKAYNDTYGHLGGDMGLKTVAATIRDSLDGPGRFVARYGGEEFGIVLPGTSREDAAALAESLRVRVERREIAHARSQVSRFLTISLGVATVVPAFGNDAESLVSAADKGLYEAKRTRNRVVAEDGWQAEAAASAEGDFRGL